MVFPLVPVLAVLAIFGGAGTLVWYDSLTAQQKEKANLIAEQYAREHYQKSIRELSKREAQEVYRLTRAHFG
jgi:hypothetical protein